MSRILDFNSDALADLATDDIKLGGGSGLTGDV